MIVPKYWAEGRARDRRGGRQITVRRWGWSDASPEDALRHGDARAADALQRILAGETLRRREFRVSYNGADGVPIREEIVSRHGETLVTRNLYGALCLNTPDVLFADIDFPDTDPPGRSPKIEAGAEAAARGRVVKFMSTHPSWRTRIYRTPAGLRVLVLHQLFDPSSASVAEFFQALGSDPLYVRMCTRQFCFRARVSPKPWRIGIGRHFRPAIWPVNAERKAARDQWVTVYDKAAAGHASCRYLETLGTGAEDPAADEVRRIHDDLSRALTPLPIA
ncbi:MAG TPA: hypothetical protein VE981_14705 [Planctomycetota bacterium]|nr:hypothetical protein [Planctomycetota bacterium]